MGIKKLGNNMWKIDGQVVKDIGNKIWETEIDKPLPIKGEIRISLNGLLLDTAIRRGYRLLVRCQGVQELIDPQVWIDESILEKKIKRRPDEPMRFYIRTLTQPDKNKNKQTDDVEAYDLFETAKKK